MSLASDALQLGVSTILCNPVLAGETVTFRGASHDVHIDRLAGDGTEPGGPVITSTKETWSVDFLSSVTEPIPGEIITTGQGHKMRIESVRYLGFAWQCRCSIKR